MPDRHRADSRQVKFNPSRRRDTPLNRHARRVDTVVRHRVSRRWQPIFGFLALMSLLWLMLLWTSFAHAETLRCNGRATEVGDSRLAVLTRCGEPKLKDSFCAPVYVAPTLQQVPAPLAGLVAPCLQIDEWQYDRGPGNLTATVRFQYGRVQSITYGQPPS